MKQLIVRNVEDGIVTALKRRPGRSGRSAEAEHRDILRAALAQDAARPSLKDLLASIPNVGADEDFLIERDMPRDSR